MSSIRTIRDYSPLDRSHQPSQSPPPLFQFGQRNPDGSITQVGCLEGFFPGFSIKSFVFVITIVEIVIFLITEILAMQYEGNPAAFLCVLYRFGAKFTPSILIDKEYYRLIMPILLHGGFFHIFMNMLGQCLFGFKLEKTYGTSRFFALYLLAGIGGNLLSAIYLPESPSIGASSSLYGVLALQIGFFVDNWDSLGPRRKISILLWIAMILANLNMSFYATAQTVTDQAIDNYGHMGGFLVGGLMAVLFTKRENNINFRKMQKLALVGLIAYFIISGIQLVNMDTRRMSYILSEISAMCYGVL